jgi:hypothetical protein
MKLNFNSMLPFTNFNLNFNSNFLLLFLFLLLSGCKQPTQPKLEPKAELKLTLEDVSCTEAWIQLKTTNLQLPATLTLYKNNVAQNNILCYGDTLLYIDSLLPNQTYKFKVVLTNNPQPTTYPQPPSSNEVTVTTMDTTSHNFTWQSWEFGECSNSVLYDVAIIDENNIWAVGEIYMRDSLGNCDPKAYNAVHWDGTKWELKRIYTYSACSSIYYAPLKSIYAFSENNIVVTSGGGMWWFNGNKWNAECSINPLLTGAINKLWGSSSNDLYAVGNNGNIAHWDGVRWRKIESGTDLAIRDIWGDFDEETNSYEILAIAAEIDINKGSKILRINKNFTAEENNRGLSWQVGGIWFKPKRKYYVAGAGVHYKHLLSDSAWYRNLPGIITNYVGFAIRGNNTNDVFAAGAFLEIAHYNGVSWRNYLNEISSSSGAIGRVATKENIIAAVGGEGRSALIIIGKRQ